MRDVMIANHCQSANPVQPLKATIKYSILWLVQFRPLTKCLCGSNVAAKILPSGVIRPQNPSRGSSTLDKRKVWVLTRRVAGEEFPGTVVRVVCSVLQNGSAAYVTHHLLCIMLGQMAPSCAVCRCCHSQSSRSDKCGTDLQEHSRDALKIL